MLLDVPCDVHLPMPVQRRLRNRVRTRDVPERIALRQGLIYRVSLRVRAYGARPSHAKTLRCPDWKRVVSHLAERVASEEAESI